DLRSSGTSFSQTTTATRRQMSAKSKPRHEQPARAASSARKKIDSISPVVLQRWIYGSAQYRCASTENRISAAQCWQPSSPAKPASHDSLGPFHSPGVLEDRPRRG